MALYTRNGLVLILHASTRNTVYVKHAHDLCFFAIGLYGCIFKRTVIINIFLFYFIYGMYKTVTYNVKYN